MKIGDAICKHIEDAEKATMLKLPFLITNREVIKLLEEEKHVPLRTFDVFNVNKLSCPRVSKFQTVPVVGCTESII